MTVNIFRNDFYGNQSRRVIKIGDVWMEDIRVGTFVPVKLCPWNFFSEKVVVTMHCLTMEFAKKFAVEIISDSAYNSKHIVIGLILMFWKDN